MDLFPLYNSLRIAFISTLIVLILGVAAAYLVVHLPRFIRGILDSLFTLPLVLPPTVVGYLLLLLLGAKRPFGVGGFCHFSHNLSAHVQGKPGRLRSL